MGKDFYLPDAISFYFSYKEIFLDNIYKFNPASKNPNILDLGSNIGTSIIYFKTTYPNSKIIGVEADPNIYKILKKNVMSRKYNDIKLINKALSDSSDKSVKFYQEGSDGGRAFPIEGKSFIEVPTIKLDNLIKGKVDFFENGY